MIEYSGAELIQDERIRQISEEGWTFEHDDEHQNFELTLAAKGYLVAVDDIRWGRKDKIPPMYSWPKGWDWKPSPDIIPNLIKAGALIAAEIDRLQRINAPSSD